MPAIVRKTATKIVNGRVSRKNRSVITSVYGYTIEKVPAGRGFTHVVSPQKLEEFIELIPDWKKHSYRLERIILTRGYEDFFGYHQDHRYEKTATISLCPWPKKLWAPMSVRFFRNHQYFFDRLGVTYQIRLSNVICRFTVTQARAFSLLHVFLHELGHHIDWQHRRGERLRRVEEYAEAFATGLFDIMFPLYKERFGDPSKSDTLNID